MKKKKDKFRKIKFIKIILIILTAVIFLFLLIFNPLTFLTIHKVGMSIIGCNGIERYYTGEGFENDSLLLERDYAKYGDSFNGTILRSGFSIIPMKISSLGSGGHFDCNDFSNAVMCLAKQYNIKCKPVFIFSAGNGGWFNLYSTHFKTICENGQVYE